MCLACGVNHPLPSLRRSLKALSHGAAKAAGARLRDLGWLQEQPDWQQRVEQCARCPMRTSYLGITYCGKPLLRALDREVASEGCGCPVHAKAKDPEEHCPVNIRHRAATGSDGDCDCKWCAARAGSIQGVDATGH